LSTLEKVVLIGVVLAFVVISYFFVPVSARRSVDHAGAHRWVRDARHLT
jgi:hypothetical protein